MTPVEPWLIDHLIANGHLTETGLSRRARPRRCANCGLFTMTGLDDDICAFEVQTDPVPLSALGEALALLEGRHTWALHREANRWVLDRRGREDITARPAGTAIREDVLRQHRCGSPRPLTAPSTFPDTTVHRLPAGSPAPF